MLAELGSPSQTFEKVDDRLGIHRPASDTGMGAEDDGVRAVGQPCESRLFILSQQPTWLKQHAVLVDFWNYFNLGLDILILPTAVGHLVHKIVLHSNLVSRMRVVSAAG